MDVVLLKAVERLGSEGTVVRVKPGFARNYLIPRGLALPATETQVKIVAEQARQRATKDARFTAQAEALKQQLERLTLAMTLAVGEGGKAFGSVTAHDILEALTRQGLTLDKRALRLEHPIKTLGTHAIPVRLHPDVTATLKLVVDKGG